MSEFSSWSGRGLDPARVVQIRSDRRADQHFGTGYRVTDDLVLTAAHVLASAGGPGEVQTTLWAAGLEPVAGQECWRRNDLDLALVRLDDPGSWPAVAPVAWGRVDRTAGVARVAFRMIGYPVSNEMDLIRSKDDRSGWIPLLSYEEHRRYALDVQGPPPARPRPDRTLWEGVSGAAVFSAGLLIGVVRADQISNEPGRLIAVPVEEAARDEDFRSLTGLTGLVPIAAVPARTALTRPVEAAIWAAPTVGEEQVAVLKQRLEARGIAVRSDAVRLDQADLLRWWHDADSSAALSLLVLGDGSNVADLQRSLERVRLLVALSMGTPRVAATVTGPGIALAGERVFSVEDGFEEMVRWCTAAQDTSLDERPGRLPRPEHPYPLSTAFVGRLAERRMLTGWLLTDKRPVCVLKAIGGMGKSALAWVWLMGDLFGRLPQDAAQAQTGAQELEAQAKLSGAYWFSFYQPDASVASFVRGLLDYARPGGDWAAIPLSDAIDQLHDVLHSERLLLVMDGLERELRAYCRLDAGQLTEEHADAQDRLGRTAADPSVGRLLRLLCDPTMRSRVLITTRLIPADLEDRVGDPVQACRVEDLSSLTDQDVVAIFRTMRIEGTDAEIVAACAPYGGHPLTVRLLAGLLVGDLKQPGDVRAARRKRPEQRTHVIAESYDTLSPVQRDLLSRISACRSPMTYSLVESLAQQDYAAEVESALAVLGGRGLVMFDRAEKKFHLHPIVRSYAYGRLINRQEVHAQIADQLEEELEEAFPGFEDEEDAAWEMATVAKESLVELYYQLIFSGQGDDGVGLLFEALVDPLNAIGDYTTLLSCLQTLCDDEEFFLSMVEEWSLRCAIRTVWADLALKTGRTRLVLEILARHDADVPPEPEDEDEQAEQTEVMLGLESVRARAFFLIGEYAAAEALGRDVARHAREVESLPVEYDTVNLLTAIYGLSGDWERQREQGERLATVTRLLFIPEDAPDDEPEPAYQGVLRDLLQTGTRMRALPQAVPGEPPTPQVTELLAEARDGLIRWMDLVDQTVAAGAADRLMGRMQVIQVTTALLGLGLELGPGELQRMDQSAGEALRDSRRFGLLFHEAIALSLIADLRAREGRFQQANEVCEELLAIAQRYEMHLFEVAAWIQYGTIAVRRGEPEMARSCLARAEALITRTSRIFFARALEQARALPQSLGMTEQSSVERP